MPGSFWTIETALGKTALPLAFKVSSVLSF